MNFRRHSIDGFQVARIEQRRMQIHVPLRQVGLEGQSRRQGRDRLALASSLHVHKAQALMRLGERGVEG